MYICVLGSLYSYTFLSMYEPHIVFLYIHIYIYIGHSPMEGLWLIPPHWSLLLHSNMVSKKVILRVWVHHPSSLVSLVGITYFLGIGYLKRSPRRHLETSVSVESPLTSFIFGFSDVICLDPRSRLLRDQDCWEDWDRWDLLVLVGTSNPWQNLLLASSTNLPPTAGC